MHYNTANRSRFNFTIANSNCPDLRVFQFTFTEHISDLFRLELEFVSENQQLAPDTLLQKTALLEIIGEHETQYVNGIICQCLWLESGHRFARYSISLVPMAWFLNYRKACRIFQNLSVVEIINQLFEEAGLVASRHYQWSIDRNYPKRDYCCQYNETEWQFISRLMSEEGIHFHYQHSFDKHLMVLGDSKTALSFIEQNASVMFQSNSGLTETQEHINQFKFSQHTHSGKITLRDYNFNTPERSLQHSIENDINPALEVYQYPGHYQDEQQAEFYSQLRLQQHNTLRIQGQAKSNVQRLRAGRLFNLTGHRYQANNTEQLIITITHHGKQPQSLDEDTPSDTQEGSSFYNEFKTIPGNTSFRPAFNNKKPLIHGQQYAFVTGPEGEEIYVNEFGQFKVQFLWDREGQQDEKSSCWLRVNNEQADRNWGQIMCPRIGQQMLVEFEHGDPDRPVISGRNYNGDSLPPYPLPGHKTRSTTKSNSSPGGNGYNEIRFEDKQSHEQIYFHSEKDLDIRCKHDRREYIGNTRSLIVDNEQYEHIKADNHQKIDQQCHQKIGANLSQTITGQQQIHLGQKYLLNAQNNIHIKSETTLLEAGNELTFKAAGGFIKINASGVTINGVKVNLNSGGSPGSMTPSSPVVPAQAIEADKDIPGQSFKAIPPDTPYDLSAIKFHPGSGLDIQLEDSPFSGCRICNDKSSQETQQD